ncbi:MAG: hypothetical protein AB7H43_13370 [Acidimicrobiia bacterium]
MRDEMEDPAVPLVDGVVGKEGVVDDSRARQVEEVGGDPLDEGGQAPAVPGDDLEIDDDDEAAGR